MTFLYNLAIQLYVFVVRLWALAGNKKASLWINGRKKWREVLQEELKAAEKRIWFHCSSLGEFEQARPVIEKVKSAHPEIKIVLTFFSPSGYEIRKNYSGADYVFYLPADTSGNAKSFLDLVNPSHAIFTKYEYWHHYFHCLERRKIPLYMISAIFRKNDRFFSWYGGFFRNMLKCVTHFFVQEETSKQLLAQIGFNNVTVAGDTRFDRVVQGAAHPKEIAAAGSFSSGRQVMVAGSTWEADEKMLAELYKSCEGKLKLIIAPHEISESRIKEVMKIFSGARTELFSKSTDMYAAKADVLVIDNIGMLSSLYRYGSMAYVGGGFGKGIHNTLEAAVYGMPVFFGPNYEKFNEAKELIHIGGAYSVDNSEQLSAIARRFMEDVNECGRHGRAAGDYVRNNAGATQRVVEKLGL